MAKIFSPVNLLQRGGVNRAQEIADQVMKGSLENRVQLNSNKCKDLRISFARNMQDFEPIVINEKELEVVELRIVSLPIYRNVHEILDLIVCVSTLNIFTFYLPMRWQSTTITWIQHSCLPFWLVSDPPMSAY